MKKITAIMAGVFLAGITNANLVVNGSFEEGTVGSYSGTALPKTDNVLPGWRLFDTSKAAVVYELIADATEATDGNNYVKITSTTLSGKDAGLDIWPTGSGAAAVTPGRAYIVSFDAKRVAGTDNKLALVIKTVENSVALETFVDVGISLTSDWATVTYEVTPTQLTSGGAEPNMYIAFRPKDGAVLLDETICIDNVSMVEKVVPAVAKVVDTDFTPPSHTYMQNLSIDTDTERFRGWSDSSPVYNISSTNGMVIYGGVHITADSGTKGGGGVIGIFTTSFNAMFARTSADATNSTEQVLYLWDSADFLTSGVTAFDESANSVLSVTTGNFTGDNGGGLRFVIRSGNTYYVANQTSLSVGQSASTATLSGDSAGLQWAEFDPADFDLFTDDDANLGFGALTFSSMTFSNVTGVGLIANALSSVNTQIVLNDFQATLVSGVPVPVATVVDTDFTPSSHVGMSLTVDTDTERFRAWSDSVPAYNISSTNGMVIYGGVHITADSGAKGGAGVIGIYTTPFNSIYARTSVDATNSTAQAFYLWDSADFLIAGVTVFDESANSVLSVTTKELTGDQGGGLRFVIRDGSTYYVANQTSLDVGQSDSTATLSGNTAGLQWAAFDPADFDLFTDDDANLGFGALSFSSMTFSNVTGVGLIANALSSVNSQIVINDFQARLTDGGPVSIPVFFALFTDHMVLQRNDHVAVYGTAGSSNEVTVTFDNQTKVVTADSGGQWMATLDPMAASFTPRTLTASTSVGSVSVTNVLVGDVWFASGQSNMDTPFSGFTQISPDGKANPNIRLLMGALVMSATPQETPVLHAAHGGSWRECDETYLNSFSVTAYFYGAKLQAELDIPIGLIESAWGATIAEAWTPADKMLELGYSMDDSGELDRGDNSVLYNAMVHPFRNFTFKGVIWYQGESNSQRALAHYTLFPGLIESWRDAFGRGDIPFYYVQLAPYGTVNSLLEGATWAWLRDSQTAALSVTNTGMAVITDLGEYEDIHPQDKQPVGDRLALHALKAEGMDVVADSPLYSGAQFNGGQVTISFNHADTGLQTQEVIMNKVKGFAPQTDPDAYVVPASSLAGFTICGENKHFVAADAVISGNQVIVSSPSVPTPVAVRYAWENFPLCNLFSMEGLPASPFRTDSFDPRSVGDLYPGNTDDFGEAGTVNTGTGECVVTATNIAGVAGYVMSPNSGSSVRYGYYKTQNAALKYGATPYAVVEILYYDQGDGSFYMTYDATNGPWASSGITVDLTDSREWRVVTGFLTDAYFGNRCNGYDIRLNSTSADLIIGGVFFSALQGDFAYYDWATAASLLKQGQYEDMDSDGSSNYQEFLDGTDPWSGLPSGSYVRWMESYPAAGGSTNYMDDPDGDGMNNLLEYALGGEPDVFDASSVQPAAAMESGWMVYVYKQRKNYEGFGLDYSVLSGADLVSGPPTNATTVIGSGEYDSDFNLVTNGMPADASQSFMQLKVQKTD
jgi:sialate O-acetylesterase